MTSKKLYFLHFPLGEAQWLVFNGQTLAPAEPPPAKADGYILAIIPDSYFFYYQPANLQTKSDRTLQAAARLQMQHAFPAPPEKWGFDFFRPLKGRILGFMYRPELGDFLERHREILSRANTVTTSLGLTWFTASLNGLPTWNWEDGHGQLALADQERLFYFRGGPNEMAERTSALLPPGESPVALDIQGILADLYNRRPKWSQFRIPLPAAAQERLDTGFLRRCALVITLIAAFLLAGQISRLNAWRTSAAALNQEMQALYSAALGPESGSDPYGKLLFALDQLRSGGGHGFEVLDCLKIISSCAPPSLSIEGVNFSGDTGMVTGMVKGYEQVDKFMDDLKAQNRFQFTLDQAVNTDKGIRLSLKVAMLR